MTDQTTNFRVQEECIDLPGEVLQCTLRSDKLKVILRLHRDVIFDIKLGNGKSYTIEATQSDFYNARDKKLVYALAHDKVSFKDGERLHLWITRGFIGELVLKSEGKVMMRLEPNKLDSYRYSDDPKEKPAPVIVAIGGENLGKSSNAPNSPQPALSHAPTMMNEQINQKTANDYEKTHNQNHASSPWHNLQRQSSATEKDEWMCIVECDTKHAPSEAMTLLKIVKTGGTAVPVDKSESISYNWVLAQAASVFTFGMDNKNWIKDAWNVKFYLKKQMHKAGEKLYVIFKGLSGDRKLLTESRYAMEGKMGAKMLSITAGAGSVKTMGKAAWASARDIVIGPAARFAVYFSIALDVGEWLYDYQQIDPKTGKPTRDFSNLVATVGIDLLKMEIAAVLAVVTMGIIIVAASAVGFAVIGGVVVVGTVAFSLLYGGLLQVTDNKSGITKGAAEVLRGVSRYLESQPDYVGVDYQFDRAYGD